MEARAFKSSLRRELTFKSTQQVLIEELWCATGISGVPSEDFSVDDLLDFSNGEFADESVEEEEQEEEEKDSVENSISSNFTDSTLANQLAVPVTTLLDNIYVTFVPLICFEIKYGWIRFGFVRMMI